MRGSAVRDDPRTGRFSERPTSAWEVLLLPCEFNLESARLLLCMFVWSTSLAHLCAFSRMLGYFYAFSRITICLREYHGNLLPPGALSLSLLILFILQCLSTPSDNISNRVGTTIARCAKYAARRGNKYTSRKIRNPVSLTH
jgi:hypothetical protein